jgi:glyoxylase-like metal-dependent hydrolase (beta-lactamase superfamily II)
MTSVVTDGAELPGGIVPFTQIPNFAGDDETAYWLPRHRALAVGDVLINTRLGLRIWGDENAEALGSKLRDRVERALLGLAALPIELILVSHGEPIAGDGRQALRGALDSEPWQRPDAAPS